MLRDVIVVVVGIGRKAPATRYQGSTNVSLAKIPCSIKTAWPAFNSIRRVLCCRRQPRAAPVQSGKSCIAGTGDGHVGRARYSKERHGHRRDRDNGERNKFAELGNDRGYRAHRGFCGRFIYFDVIDVWHRRFTGRSFRTASTTRPICVFGNRCKHWQAQIFLQLVFRSLRAAPALLPTRQGLAEDAPARDSAGPCLSTCVRKWDSRAFRLPPGLQKGGRNACSRPGRLAGRSGRPASAA